MPAKAVRPPQIRPSTVQAECKICRNEEPGRMDDQAGLGLNDGKPLAMRMSTTTTQLNGETPSGQAPGSTSRKMRS
jgi:hypothetical protein